MHSRSAHELSRRAVLGAGASLWLPASARAPVRLLCGDLKPLSDELTPRVQTLAQQIRLAAPVEVVPWARAWREARGLGRALMYPLARTPEREAAWRWLGMLGRQDKVLLVCPGVPPGHLAEAGTGLRGLRVGVLRDTVPHCELQQQGFSHIEAVSSDRQNALKFALGRIDAWYALGTAIDHWTTQLGLDPHFGTRHARGVLDIYLAATTDLEPELLSQWTGAFNCHIAGGAT